MYLCQLADVIWRLAHRVNKCVCDCEGWHSGTPPVTSVWSELLMSPVLFSGCFYLTVSLCWHCFDGMLQEVRYVPQIQSLLLIILHCLFVCCSPHWMRYCIIKCVEQAAEEVRGRRNRQDVLRTSWWWARTEGFVFHWHFHHAGVNTTLCILCPSIRPSVHAKSCSVRSVTGDPAVHCNFSVKTLLRFTPCAAACHRSPADCTVHLSPPHPSPPPPHTHKGHFIYTLSVSHSFTMIS